MANKLSAWIRIQELYKHPTVLFPFLLGTAIAWSEAGIIDWRVFAVSIIATYFITNGTFISNEYFDYETDRMNIERVGGDRAGVTTTGGTRVLAEGLLPRKQVLIASILFFIAAIPLGILLQFHFNTGILTMPIGVLGILIGLFYTAPPLKASYCGFGELFMAIGFTIPVFMGYYLQQGFNWLPLIVALPWTLDVPALKIIREFPDYEADLSVNRRNLVVIFGRQKMAPVYILLTVCSLILFIPVIFIIREIAVLLLLLPTFFLLRSLIPMIKGEWKSKEGLDTICKNGFIGMLFILVAFMGIFVLKGLLSVF
jgi:1,4-dihydroxy-2-naphthoate octaprenyltransferase